MPESPNNLHSTRIRIPDSQRAIQDYLWEQGWTDGLPVVAPTEPLVREMLSGYTAATLPTPWAAYSPATQT